MSKKYLIFLQYDPLTQYSNATFLLKDFSVLVFCALSDILSDYKKGNKGKIYSGVRKKESRYQRGRMNLGYESRKRSFFLVLLSSAQQ